jgi:hypothetical protein
MLRSALKNVYVEKVEEDWKDGRVGERGFVLYPSSSSAASEPGDHANFEPLTLNLEAFSGCESPKRGRAHRA